MPQRFTVKDLLDAIRDSKVEPTAQVEVIQEKYLEGCWRVHAPAPSKKVVITIPTPVDT